LFDVEQDAVICRVTGVLRAGVFDVTLKADEKAEKLKR